MVLFYSTQHDFQPPNGLDHLPPVLARRQNHDSMKTGKWPTHTSAEGGQVEPVLGGAVVMRVTPPVRPYSIGGLPFCLPENRDRSQDRS